MEKKVYDLVIDEELERVAPPLADYELEILKTDIHEHGCKFPLIVWGDLIVDGHNRYRICREEDIPFGIEQMEFENKTEAKLWIVKNQLGRRNLKDFQRCEMVIPLEEEIKADAEQRRREKISIYRRTGRTDSTLNPSRKSMDLLSALAGVSVGTMFKVKHIVAKADEEQKELIRSGKKSINFIYTKLKEAENSPIRQVGKEKAEEPAVRQVGKEKAEEPTEEPEEIVDPVDTEEEEEPSDFASIKEQLDYAFSNFMGDLEYALDWLSGETATPENETRIIEMIDELMDKAKKAVIKKMEEEKNE